MYRKPIFVNDSASELTAWIPNREFLQKEYPPPCCDLTSCFSRCSARADVRLLAQPRARVDERDRCPQDHPDRCASCRDPRARCSSRRFLSIMSAFLLLLSSGPRRRQYKTRGGSFSELVNVRTRLSNGTRQWSLTRARPFRSSRRFVARILDDSRVLELQVAHVLEEQRVAMSPCHSRNLTA